eukprot:2145945-Prymnesium_polylepis.1
MSEWTVCLNHSDVQGGRGDGGTWVLRAASGATVSPARGRPIAHALPRRLHTPKCTRPSCGDGGGGGARWG